MDVWTNMSTSMDRPDGIHVRSQPAKLKRVNTGRIHFQPAGLAPTSCFVNGQRDIWCVPETSNVSLLRYSLVFTFDGQPCQSSVGRAYMRIHKLASDMLVKPSALCALSALCTLDIGPPLHGLMRIRLRCARRWRPQATGHRPQGDMASRVTFVTFVCLVMLPMRTTPVTA